MLSRESSMAKIVVVASSKGGVGKTLVSMVLASRLATDGLRVAAIDADPNGALADWRANVWDGPAFVVEADSPGIKMTELPKMGLNTSPMAQVEFDGVRVPRR